MKILILGCGNVGLLMAKELSKTHDILGMDNSIERVELFRKNNLKSTQLDVQSLSSWHLTNENPDLVINALPGHLGFAVASKVIACKLNLVDISFFPEDSFALKSMAEENKVFAAFDCGIAPGFMNMILGDAEKKHKEIDNFICYVGGLPMNEDIPFGYKATFSLSDVLEEYIRPARFIQDGEIVSRNPMEDFVEIILKIPNEENELCQIQLDAFWSDGLRTALKGRKTKNIMEMTLRYPGHLSQMKALADSGFLDKEKTINGIKPFDFTKEVLKDVWKFNEGERDMTIMQVEYDVLSQNKIHQMTLCDYQKTNDESSMARTTGFTCCAVVSAFEKGFLEKKFYTPEEIGEHCYAFVESYLKEKGISISWTTEDIYLF